MNWWEIGIPRNTQVWYGRVISEWILKEKSKITWLKSLLKMKTRPPGVFCGIYLTIWHGRIRDALKENLDFPWFNCWILRCLLLEKSHFLQAQHPIVKYQLAHLVSNDSNDMSIVKGDAIQPHWFCQKGLQCGCLSSEQSWKRRATTASLNGGNLNLITELIWYRYQIFDFHFPTKAAQQFLLKLII